MGNPAGVQRDFEKLEQRRLTAADLLRQGLHQAEVARQVGAHRQSVSRWAQELKEGWQAGVAQGSTPWSAVTFAPRACAAHRAWSEAGAGGAGL